VTVATAPSAPSQVCTVANGSGTVASANVTNIVVSCATNTYTVGGTVSGLAGVGLRLQLNGGNALDVAANGSFTFAGAIADGAPYAVTVHTQPAGPTQTCLVTGGSGTMSSANVTGVQVNCTTTQYRVSATVTGLSGAGLVLQNSGGDDLPVAGNGSFTFATSVASGAGYSVTVKTQPSSPSQTCTVASSSGTVGAANVTDVVVSCAINTYTVGGNVTGLSPGSSLQLRLNGGNALNIAANGGFQFAALADGSVYQVTVATQPSAPRQTCSVTNGAGTLAGVIVTNVAVHCSVVAWSGIKQFGSARDDVANAVAVAANGDVVVVGCFSGALTGTYKNTCDMPGGNANVAVQKYDVAGDAVWAAPALLGSSANTQANAVAIDGAGNIYVTGISQAELDGQPVVNSDDVFVTKYDSNGNRLWTRVFGSLSADRGNAIAIDAGGNLYIAGSTFGNLDGAHAGGNFDAFVAKFDAGELGGPTVAPTIYQFGSAQSDVGVGVAVDAGGIYVSGVTVGSMSGANAGGEDVFVTKLDASGTVVWTKQIGTAHEEASAGIAVVGGNVYAAGYTGGNLTPDPTDNLKDLFVVKYDGATGNEVWRRQLASHLHDIATGVAVDASGNVFVTGYTNGNFAGSTNADPSTNTNDLFLVKYDAGGTRQWTREFGSTTDDRAYAVATDAAGSAFVVGYTLGALPGNANAGGADMFVLKYDAAGTRQ